VWGSGAHVILRIEDHDRERCRPEYETGLVDDLAWLGYRYDLPLVRQSERDMIYREALEILRAQGLVYACDCTRRAIQERAADIHRPSSIAHRPSSIAHRPSSIVHRPSSIAPRPSPLGHRPSNELRYDGYCRDRGLALGDGVSWRVRMDPGVERFTDGILGPQAQDPAAQCGDVMIRDRLGNWTYQFVAAADDFRQGVDLVIRGADLLASTGRQIRIARLLGRQGPPEFRHHPLIMKSPGQKLSKSDGDTGVRDLRALGWTAARVRSAARIAGGLNLRYSPEL
jgi:glutamyl-tRNA synthetase/glutamyl-Q tRNA(Asp) synthetase